MSGNTSQIRSLEFRVKMLEAFAFSNGNEEIVRQVNNLTVQLERVQKELKDANTTIRVLKSFFGETQFDDALRDMKQEEEEGVQCIDVLDSDQAGLWGALKTSLSLTLSKEVFITWFDKTQEIDFDGTILTVGVVNSFNRDWVESRYTEYIEKVAKELTGQEVTVKFVLIER